MKNLILAAATVALVALVAPQTASAATCVMGGQAYKCSDPAIRGRHVNFIPGCSGPQTKGKVVRFGKNAFVCSGNQP